MRRSVLLTIIGLGAVLTLAGAGTFAPFTDRATSGPNSAASAERPKAADLKLAYNVSDPFGCASQTYADDTTSPGVQMTDAVPGSKMTAFYCLKNAGSSPLTVTNTVIDVVEVDQGCTGDEASLDTTCGGNQAGELGTVLATYTARLDCASGSGPVPTYGGFLASPTPMAIGTVGPGEIACGFVEVSYPLNRPAEDVLRAQTDTVTWKFAFDGTT